MVRILVVQHEDDVALGRLDPGRPGGGPSDPAGTQVHVWRPYRGEPVPVPVDEPGRAVDALVVLGGTMGALDDDVAPWLPTTRRMLAGAVRQALPTLGICLGAQLLAAATGGTVARGRHGLEVGVVPVAATARAASDAVLGALGDGHEVVEYHFDAVAELPPDAELLETGTVYPHQGFRVGRAAWGVQYHPEVSRTGFATWVRDDAPRLLRLGKDPDAMMRDVRVRDRRLEADARTLWSAFTTHVAAVAAA